MRFFQAAKKTWTLRSLLRATFDERPRIVLLARMTLEAVGQFIVWAVFIAYGREWAKGVFGDFDREQRALEEL